MMKNIKQFFSKHKIWGIIIGISMVPALYNLSFLGSMWDPYGNLDQLPVAVVNEDKSASLNQKTLSIGQNIVGNMSKTNSLDYHFVSSDEAESGLEDGIYYMVVTLPSNMSENAATLLTDNPQKVEIQYETNQGKSLTASKINDGVMTKLKDSVSKSITTTYTQAVFNNLGQLGTGVTKMADGGQQLATGAEQLSSGSQTLTDNLALASSGSQQLLTGSQSLSTGLSTYTSGVSQLNTGLTSLSRGLGQYTSGVGRLADASSQLSNQSENLLAGFMSLTSGSSSLSQLETGLQDLTTGLSGISQLNQLSEQDLANLRNNLENLQTLSVANASTLDDTTKQTILENLAIIDSKLTSLSSSTQTISAEALSSVQATSAYQSLTSEQQKEITSALETSVNTETVDLQTIQNSSQAILSVLERSTAQDSNQSGNLQESLQTLDTISERLSQIDIGLTTQVLPNSQQLLTGLQTFEQGMSKGASSLTSGLTQYISAVNAISSGANQLSAQSDTITNGVTTLQTGSQTLADSSATLVSGGQQLSSGLATETSGLEQLASGSDRLNTGLTTLSTNLTSMTTALDTAKNQLSLVSITDNNASAVADPISLSHTDSSSVDVNGIGMAPYMIAVSLMVIALSVNVIFEKLLYKNTEEKTKATFHKKLLINAAVATLDTVMLFVALQWLGVSMVHSLLTFGVILLSSWMFMALVTLLLTISEQAGSFLALILLLLQTGSAAGSYPIELSPKIFQALNPFLPMSYVVSALRETISMTGNIGKESFILTSLLVIFIGLIFMIGYRKLDKEASLDYVTV